MSPRLASATTGTSSGIDRAQAFEGGHPRGPEGLEEREVGLDRGGVRQGRLEEELGEALDAGQVAGEPLGECLGVGVEPEAEDRPRRCGAGRQPVEVRAGHWAGDGDAAGSSSAGMYQSGLDAASRPDTSVRGRTSSTVHAPGVPPSLARWRSTL